MIGKKATPRDARYEAIRPAKSAVIVQQGRIPSIKARNRKRGLHSPSSDSFAVGLVPAAVGRENRSHHHSFASFAAPLDELGQRASTLM